MESITKKIKDLKTDERSLLERWFGHPLGDGQRVILNVVPETMAKPKTASDGVQQVPSSWKVLEGITPEELEQLDTILSERANFTRSFPMPYESSSD